MNDIKGIIEDVEKSNLVSDKVIKKVIKIIGQEEWNNIHDEESDICTTTGELIITLKGIAELEKEKCELLGLIQAKDKLIEKMKCCKNCEFSIPICDTHCQDCDEHYSNWRLAE